MISVRMDLKIDVYLRMYYNIMTTTTKTCSSPGSVPNNNNNDNDINDDKIYVKTDKCDFSGF